MSTISCQQRQFGTLETGQSVTCYSLRNTSGMTVNLLNYGATLNAIQIPDSRGKMHEIILSLTQLQEYTKSNFYSGATLAYLPSRYGVQLNKLHQTVWEAENMAQGDEASVLFTLDDIIDLRYPFSRTKYNLKIKYTLTVANELIIQSQIETDKPLPIAVTHHPIWNLTGPDEGNITDHILQIWSSQYSIIDQSGLPQNAQLDIQEKTAFDFKKPQRIAEKWEEMLLQSKQGICYHLQKNENSAEASVSELAARVKAPVSGRTLEVYTNQPGLQFYLDSTPSQSPRGFCLNPLPLINSTHQTNFSTPENFTYETRYKLVW